MVQSWYGVLFESRLRTPLGSSRASKQLLSRNCSHYYRRLHDILRGVVDVGYSLDSAKASEASCTTFVAINPY